MMDDRPPMTDHVHTSTPCSPRFITFEGCEGVGKSTQVARVAAWLQERGVEVVTTREPGGTALGKALRSMLLKEACSDCAPLAELFLMLADRAQDVARVIRPALERGDTVICDRYNDSSLVYQAHGHRLEEAAVRQSCSLATGGLDPDLTVLLDMDPALAMERIHRSLDRMEQKGLEFHRGIRAAYLELARQEPERFVVVDASQDPDVVARQIQDALLRR